MSRIGHTQQRWKTPKGWGVIGHGAAEVLSPNATHSKYAAAGSCGADEFADQSLALYFMYDNLPRIHSTLRDTPALEAKVTMQV